MGFRLRKSDVGRPFVFDYVSSGVELCVFKGLDDCTGAWFMTIWSDGPGVSKTKGAMEFLEVDACRRLRGVGRSHGFKSVSLLSEDSPFFIHWVKHKFGVG